MHDTQLTDYLSQFVLDERFQKMNNILKNRTRYLTVVLEDIFQPQNASAILRSCECFGIQDLHIIEGRNKFKSDPGIDVGASKWLSLYHYKKDLTPSAEVLTRIKRQGYRIVATTPHEGDVNLESFDLSKGKTALVFGTELTGLSAEAFNIADEFLKIPMFGFTESFNLSNSVAIILHCLTSKLRSSNIAYHLSKEEANEVLFNWLCKNIKDSNLLINRYFKNAIAGLDNNSQ